MDDFVLSISDSSDENDTPERTDFTVTPEVKSTTSTSAMNSGTTNKATKKFRDPGDKSGTADRNGKDSENNDSDLNGTKKGRAKRGQRNKLFDENSKFLANFDPGKSQREKRKLERNIRVTTKHIGMYNEKGVLRSNGVDLCDCLNQQCPGCHMPCADCGISKCGKVCRKHRKWIYERVEVDAKDSVKEFPFKD